MNESFKELTSYYTQLNDLKSDFRNPNLYPLILGCLKGKSVFDIGCGAGHFLNFCRINGYEVKGAEPNQDLIELSKKLYGNSLKLRFLYANEIDQIKERFDNVTMIDVLEHVEKDVDVLYKTKNILTDDGHLVILVPSHPHLYGLRDKLLGHYRRYSLQELKDKLEKTGFEIIKTRRWNMMGYFPYLISEKVFKKVVSSKVRQHNKGPLLKLINGILQYWFKYVESQVDFGFGLSLLIIAKQKKNGT